MSPLALLLLGCAAPPERLVAPDPGRDGLDGADGPWGATLVERRYVARVTETVETRVVYPSDGADTPALQGAPVVVFEHGGFVEADRYLWLAAHLATRGYVVALPAFPLDLAITAAGNGSAALDGVLADEVGAALPAAVGGHSLGGVTGAMGWVEDPRFEGDLLLASFPAAGTEVVGRDGPALSLTGALDGQAALEDVRAGVARYDGGRLGVVDGLTHYGWTDGVTEAEAAREATPTVPVDDARRAALSVLDPWLDLVLREDPTAQARLDAEHPGVTLEAR